MANGDHDIVVIGAGHNGLIAAAYLAKAGLDVCVVEIQDKVGGSTITGELTVPGFKHDQGSVVHLAIQRNPLIINDELGLKSKYGLKYITCDPVLSSIFPDGRALTFYRDINKTCESIAQFSQKDAETYPKFCENATLLMRTATLSMFSPPPPFGRLISFLEASEEGRETLRVILSSVMDVACEWFESEQMRITMGKYAAEAMMSPWERGTGWRILGLPMLQAGGVVFAEGGSGRLGETLQACLQDSGATIRLSSPVKSIKIDNGEAKGVILKNGKEIIARKAVISNLNVKQLFLDMLKPEELPPGFRERIYNLKLDLFSGLLQVFALNEVPKYYVGGDVDKTAWIEICPFMDDFARTFYDIECGIPRFNMPMVFIHTLADHTRAPEGKHTLWTWHFEPYHLNDGGAARWDDIRQEIAEGILFTIRKHVTNIGPENILGSWICSPFDLERWNPALIGGSIHHIGQPLSQWMPNRPLMGWTQYRTPIKKLYMCGASTHPGASVNGGGRASAQVIMEDLGIDFKKLMSS